MRPQAQILDLRRRLAAITAERDRHKAVVEVCRPIFEKRALRHVPVPGDDTFAGFIKGDMEDFAAKWAIAEKAFEDLAAAEAAAKGKGK